MFHLLWIIVFDSQALAGERPIADHCVEVSLVEGTAARVVRSTKIDIAPSSDPQLQVAWREVDGCPTGEWSPQVGVNTTDAWPQGTAETTNTIRSYGRVDLKQGAVLATLPLKDALKDAGANLDDYQQGGRFYLKVQLTKEGEDTYQYRRPFTAYLSDPHKFELSTQAVSYAYSYKIGEGWVDSLTAVSLGVHYSYLPRATVGFGVNLKLAALGTTFSGSTEGEEASPVQARLFLTPGLEVRPKGVFGENVLLFGPTVAALSGPSVAIGLDVSVVSPFITP